MNENKQKNTEHLTAEIHKRGEYVEDEMIVKLYLQRDESAISYTADKYGGRLLSLGRHITENVQTAEECVNDTYLQAWNSIPPNDPSTYFYPFLARITRHIALNRCEKENAKKRRGQYVDLAEELDECFASSDNTESVIDDMVLKESLNRFLVSIEEEKRNIFLRRYWFFDDISEISARFGYSESKVKSMLMRLRGKLREQLIKDGIEI